MFKKVFNMKVFALLAFVGLLIFAYLRSQSQPKDESNPVSVFEVKEEKPNEFEEIVPGKSSDKDLEARFGPLLKQSSYAQGLVLKEYEWVGANFPAEVVTDTSGTVKYMRIPQFNQDPVTMNEYVKKYFLGKPDLEMYTTREYNQKVYVFLSKGVALEPADISGEIFYIRYFEPTTAAEFLSTWGKDLEEKFTPEGH